MWWRIVYFSMIEKILCDFNNIELLQPWYQFYDSCIEKRINDFRRESTIYYSWYFLFIVTGLENMVIECRVNIWQIIAREMTHICELPTLPWFRNGSFSKGIGAILRLMLTFLILFYLLKALLLCFWNHRSLS